LTKVNFGRAWPALLIVLVVSCKSAPKNVEQVETKPETVEEIAVEPEAKEEPDIVEETPEVVEEIAVIVEETDNELLTKKQAMYAELGETLTAARAKRQEVMNSKFNEQYEDRFNSADDALNIATDSYGAGFESVDEAALAAAHSALDGFTSIINDAWLAKAEDLQSTSGTMQQQALKLKADNAVKQNYNYATELYNKGNAAMRGNDYAAAAGFYQEAIPAFMETINIATEKKAKAELALKNAEEKISQSEKIVEDAVKELETGENGEAL
jgi:hypothetical protein